MALSEEMVTRRCGSTTGSARSSRPLTREKIAVLAPMPSASASAPMPDTIGLALSARSESRRSSITTWVTARLLLQILFEERHTVGQPFRRRRVLQIVIVELEEADRQILPVRDPAQAVTFARI